jgi:hypothetical protein
MTIRSALFAIATMLAIAPRPGLGSEGVATVLGEEIFQKELASAQDEPAQVGKLYDLVWPRVARHYIGQKGLAATGAEVAELMTYHREFERKDRAQRGRKLEELNLRLAGDGLKTEERAWLEEFRAVLIRLARHDAEIDRLPPPDPEQQGALYAPWIEMWKMNAAVYAQYGGVVALTTFGHFPHGARAALIADYERRGLLRFSDVRLRESLFALLAKPPTMTVPPERVDFTPYWKLPIPSSYFPD